MGDYAGHRASPEQVGAPANLDTFAEVQTALAGYVAKSLFDANSILKADTDDTPVAMAIAASRLIGRKASGPVVDLTQSEAGIGAVFTAGATSADDAVSIFGVSPGLVRSAVPDFTVNGSAPAAGLSVPAALGTFSGTLLTDALTAITGLYARVDLLTGLLRSLIVRDLALGLAV